MYKRATSNVGEFHSLLKWCSSSGGGGEVFGFVLMVKPSFVVVDASVNVEDEKKRHFGRHEKKYVLLPYYSQLSIYLDEHFEHIKHGLVASVLVNENRPALRNYIYALKEFVETHGFRFSKGDHIKLIELLYLVMVKKDQWHDVVHYAARALEKLIKASEIRPSEAKLSSTKLLGYSDKFGKILPLNCESMLLPNALKKVYVFNSRRKESIIDQYLTSSCEDHKKYGAGLWFQTMWKMYEVAEMGKKWGDDLPNFFATLIYHNPDFMDWRPLYDTIFTRIIRALGLCIREGKVTVGDGSGSSSLDGFARFVSSTIGGPYCCRKQLEKMMKTIEPFLHPSNEGDHTAQVLSFLQYLIREFLGRYEDERIKKNKRKVSQEFYLKDVDVRSFVNALLQPILYSLYSKDGKSYELPAKLLMMLGTLEPGLVFPRFLENVYPAMFAVCEPHRLTQTLDCMFELVYIIGSDDKQGIERKKMEKDWVAEMEKHRSPDSPLARHSLQKLSTENKWELKNNFSTFRFHLFYFLEILIAGIDINDVSKANIAIHNLTLIFYIVPILDYSECVKHHTDLTPDEKSLCLLSTRLPVIAEWALDRMLAVIQCLAITAPKDSSSALGNFKDESTKESEEEKVLKKAIDRCVTALFTNTKYAITAKLSKKVLDFVKTNQFETQLATDMISSLIAQMTYTYIDNKDICFEMISLLLQCKSKVAYINGSIGLWYMLYMLSRIYPENTRYIADRLERPLKDWVPVREWGRMYEMAEAKMAWYVPSEKGKQLVEALLNKFLFPVVESLKDENMDRESLKKALTIINFGFSGGITCFALPPSPEFKSRHSVVPWFKPDSKNPSVLHWDIRPPSGENFCEHLVNILEKVAERLVSSKREHTQVLCTICKILHSIIHSNNADSHQLDTAVGEHGDIYTYMTIPISRKRHIFVLESQAYVAHMRNVVELPSEMFTDFHLRVARIIAKLIINDYSEVRYEALAVFSSLFSEHAIARETIVDDILPTLTNPDSTRDQLKVVDYPDVIDMYDDLWNDIGKLQKPARKHYECPKLTAFCNEWFKDLPKTGDWTAFKDPKILESARDARAARRAADKRTIYQKREIWGNQSLALKFSRKDGIRDQDILVDTLLELFGRKDLLHTRQKLCRAMLWRCQKEKCGLKTIKVHQHPLRNFGMRRCRVNTLQIIRGAASFSRNSNGQDVHHNDLKLPTSSYPDRFPSKFYTPYSAMLQTKHYSHFDNLR
ncbi:unnamed protein product [Haemonchus placei]|uniref:BLM10_mid domain-containing protein n=1 Tax=Haemonchus placei TaxID=6290 RepID=A0A158QLC6_HAEPC|nr:unnamed protein product [Haemonchus placei]